MQSVLHGYDDTNARRILQNCRAAIVSEGRLLLIEVVLPAIVEHADSAVEAMLMADINMLAVTGGRERNSAEWSSLLSSAGFELRLIVSVPGSSSNIIESIPRD